MKKSLSLVVAAAMTLTTASVAFADTAAPTTTDLTSQQKFDALKELGIFSGYPDGSAGLDKEMTRAEFAKVLTKLTMLEENAAAAKVYTDVPASHWAAGFIGASTEAKLMNGLGANKFGPSGKVTVEQIAKVADLVAGVEPAEGDVAGKVSAWAKGYVAAAIKAGLLPELPSYQTNATRALLVDVTYDLAGDVVKVASSKVVDATHIEVTFSDGGVVKKELTTPLVNGTATKVSVDYNGKSYDVTVTLTAVKATEAKQTGAKKVTVKFNQAVSAADKAALTYELKSGLTTFPVTATFADDNMSAVLSAAYLPAGDFTLTVKGSDAISLKVVAEAATKVDVTAGSLQQAAAQDLGVKIYNQFGEELTTTSAQITAFDSTQGVALNDANTGKVDLSDAAKFKIGDSVIVTAIVPSAGLSVNKTLKIMNGSLATSIKIDPVQPLAGSTRIAVADGYVLPLSMVDAQGQALKLPDGTIDLTNNSKPFAGLVFYSSDATIISSLTVKDGVITFNTKKAGTVYITITNGATSASASTAIVVNADAKVKTFQLGNSGSLIVKNEKVVLPFTAVDTYDQPIAAKDINLSNVKFNAFGSEVTPVKNAKGELEFTFNQTGTTTIYVYVDGVLQTANVGINVLDPAVYKAVNGVHDVATTYEVGAFNTFDATKITLVDNYGRVKDLTGAFTVKSSDNNIVSVANNKITGVSAGTATITVSSTVNANVTDYSFTVTVVKSSDIKSYAIDTIATLFGKSDGTTKTDGHADAVTLVGKTAGGTSVALASNVPTFVTSTDESVLKVDTNGTSVYGLKAGKSTVAAYFNGSKVAEQEVTVSEDAPVAKTVEIEKDEYTIAKNATVTPKVTVKDQYGVEIKNPVGQFIVGDKDVASVGANNVITGTKANSSTTITYVSSNGTTDAAVLVVN